MPRDRKGRFTAKRITERFTAERVTETLTVDGDTLTALPAYDGDYGGPIHGWGEGAIPGEIHWAGGWGTHPSERHMQLAQRQTQQERAEELLADWAVSVPPGTPVPQWLTDATTNMLRAGAGATPLQLKWGRDI